MPSSGPAARPRTSATSSPSSPSTGAAGPARANPQPRCPRRSQHPAPRAPALPQAPAPAPAPARQHPDPPPRPRRGGNDGPGFKLRSRQHAPRLAVRHRPRHHNYSPAAQLRAIRGASPQPSRYAAPSSAWVGCVRRHPTAPLALRARRTRRLRGRDSHVTRAACPSRGPASAPCPP